MNNSEIYFYLPDFWTFYRLNLTVLALLQEHPEYFHDNIKVGAVYGTFPSCIWNSGRCFFGDCDQANLRNTILGINSFGVPIRHTFTSTLITEDDLYDLWGNLILKVGLLEEICQGVKNEVLVNSSLLEDYLREKYPDYVLISSTTKCLGSEDFLAEVNSEKYRLSVLDYHLNVDTEFLDLLANHCPDKVELLINPYCSPKCTAERRKGHYEYLSKCQRNRLQPNFMCDLLATSFSDCLLNETTFKVEDIYETLIPKGFKHFKIEGRTNHIVDVIESYIYYMVKSEFQMRVRGILLKEGMV